MGSAPGVAAPEDPARMAEEEHEAATDASASAESERGIMGPWGWARGICEQQTGRHSHAGPPMNQRLRASAIDLIVLLGLLRLVGLASALRARFRGSGWRSALFDVDFHVALKVIDFLVLGASPDE